MFKVLWDWQYLQASWIYPHSYGHLHEWTVVKRTHDTQARDEDSLVEIFDNYLVLDYKRIPQRKSFISLKYKLQTCQDEGKETAHYASTVGGTRMGRT